MGRYGLDSLTSGLMFLACALIVINFFANSSLLSIIALFCMILAMYRMFSRNIEARRRELAMYDDFMVRPRAWWARVEARYADFKIRHAQSATQKQASQATKDAATQAKEQAKAQAKQAKAQAKAAKKQNAQSKVQNSPKKPFERAQQEKRAQQQAKGGTQQPHNKEQCSELIFFMCEECGQRLTVPKGKGTLKITCPKCGHQIIKKS